MPRLCPHFGSCGGCSRQDLPYEEQLRLKAQRVRGLLAPFGADPDVYGSPDVSYYRNKMEFSFGDVYPARLAGPNLKLGLKPKGRWYEILDLEECLLLSPETPALLAAVRRWADSEGLLPYNSHKHTGFLRHLVVREAKNGPDRMVNLVTSPGKLEPRSFVAAVRAAYPATTILWGVNGKVSDTAVADGIGVLEGPGFITETLRFPGQELRVRVSPQSFSQTNTRGAEVLYGLLRRWLGELGAVTALDLYCGGGGIALSLAGVCRKVYGAELNASAVEDARANAALNGISNAEFFSGAVETLLPSLLALKPDAVVVDPPRAGLHPSALPPLLESGAEHLFYVSCNPDSLARDLAKLEPRYKVTRCAVVDLFPHTDHVETLVALSRSPLES